jgi:acetyltransferase-like isoleucine patch superfamily enzyme
MNQITVILPVLNGMPYLTEALASLEGQTFKDFEILLWDNGSSDGSVQEAKRWIPSRLPGRVVTGRPLPLHECLAAMVNDSNSPYLARFDSDDICHPQRFALQIAALNSDPKLAVVGAQLRYIDEKGLLLTSRTDYPLYFHDILAQMLFQSALPHPAVMMRREKILAAGNYCLPKPVEDLDLWYRVAREGKLINLPEVLVDYRIHSASVTKSAQIEGTHLQAVRNCMEANIPSLFGGDTNNYVSISSRKKVFAAFSMLKWARSIARIADVPVYRVLKSPFFLFSARAYTQKQDYISKLIYFCWGFDRSRASVPQIFEKVKFLPGIRQIHRFCLIRRQTIVLRKWISTQRRRGSTIESLDINGRSDWPSFIKVGDAISLEKEVTIAFPPEGMPCPGLVIGRNVFIGRNTFISVFGRIEIGNDVLIGAYCYLAAANHRFETLSIPISEQGYDFKYIKIGRGAWLGAHVMVMPGVTIGQDAVVGSGAVVTHDIPDREVWAGVPARRIRSRR